MTKRIGMIAGSFDPITNGHTWLIEQALTVVDKLYVIVGNNPAKKYMFTDAERVLLIDAVCDPMDAHRPKRIFTTFLDNKLLINVAAELGCNFLIRGIRNAEDFNYESQVLLINRKIQPGIETLFFIPPRELTEVSSSTVKGLMGFEGWEDVVSTYVAKPVLKALKKRVKERQS